MPATALAGDVATPTAPPLLSVEGVTMRFGGIVALDGVGFDMPEGVILGLIGPNGAGKTTLFNCLSRLYPAQQGEIRFQGHPLTSESAHAVARLGISRTFQNLALFHRLTVLQNVMVGVHSWTASGFLANALRLPRVRREEQATNEHVMEVIRFLGLESQMHVPVAGLPVGTLKRVELARALAGRPRLLLLDEPASGLNHEEVEALGVTIRTIRERYRTAVLLVEHHMGLVMKISERVVVLNFGRKLAEGTPEDVRNDPEVIRAYLEGQSP